MAHKSNVVAHVENIAAPIAEKLGLSIWDIEFVKEGSTYFLRFFIDKNCGVGIDDCEAFSRAIDPVLDETDPIEQSYCLEVSSPGIERELKRDWHFEKYIGAMIKVRLIRPDDKGRRDLVGKLAAFDGEYVTIDLGGETLLFRRLETAYVRLCDENDKTFLEE